MRVRNCWIALGFAIAFAPAAAAQTASRVELSSPAVSVAVGDEVQLSARVFDAAGNRRVGSTWSTPW
jgi:hypothetical protein